MKANNDKLQTLNVKLFFCIPLFTAGWLLLSAPVESFADPVAVPVYEEPRHRLVFDKVPVKIVNVNIPPGDVSLYHFHEDPTLYIAIHGALMRSQDLGGEWGAPDANARHGTGALVFRNYRTAPQSHRVENLDDASFRLIGIVHKGKGVSITAPDQGAEIDNQWFRGTRVRLVPGAQTPGHQHKYPVLVVQVSDGESVVVVNGLATAEKTVIGNWSWHNAGVNHALRNIGESSAELVEVEIKQ